MSPPPPVTSFSADNTPRVDARRTRSIGRSVAQTGTDLAWPLGLGGHPDPPSVFYRVPRLAARGPFNKCVNELRRRPPEWRECHASVMNSAVQIRFVGFFTRLNRLAVAVRSRMAQYWRGCPFAATWKPRALACSVMLAFLKLWTTPGGS